MNKKISISLCMIVKDEEKTLERCLSSVTSFIDEIVIVDTGSTDSTKKIASKFNAKIYDFKWIDDFSAARNFAFSKATKDYIMWLDGDDLILEEEIKKLETFLSTVEPTVDYISLGYALSRDDNGKVGYSLRRNRIVKKALNFKWHGHIHEYLAVYGNGVHPDVYIDHGKVKAYTDRNLQIFRKMKEDGVEFSPRDTFYFGNELVDNGFHAEAIEQYTKFIDSNQGWIEDVKTAIAKSIDCYKILGNNNDKIMDLIFKSFKLDIPRADLCCKLGELFMEESKYNQAIFWYKTALGCIPDKSNPAINNKLYYTWIPALQICVCYSRMGDIYSSYYYNELAALYIPDSPKIEYNRNYFRTEFTNKGLPMPDVDLSLSNRALIH